MGRGRDLGRRRFLAPPRCGRPGHVTARPRARWQSGGAPGGVRDSAARAGPRGTHGQARNAAAASAAAKFPGVACARAGPAGWNMNVFRILGDLSHLLAMILLLGKIWRSKCCTGEGRARWAWGTPERSGWG